MNTYRVSLVKSYLITIEAENKTDAKHLSEFFTGDIADLSEKQHHEEHKFSITEIECVGNDAVFVEEIKENE